MTSDDLVMVQWADLTGIGFSPHDRGSAPGEFWTAAEHLLQEDLEQPPENIDSTQGHPVWTLRRVPVGGRRRWCFAVQGRRGPFGVAGSCRFAFAPPAMGAYDAWRLGRDRAADPDDLPEPGLDHDTFGRLVSEVLGGVALSRAAVPVLAGPGDAAEVVAAVLRVLPEPVSRRWSWSTCLLQRPDNPDLRVVSGQWPEEFRAADPRRADSVAHLFRRGPVTQEELETRLTRRELRHGFRWLVEYAVEHRPITRLPRCEELDDLLVELAHANHRPEWPDVPSMLASPQGLLGHLDLVATWARHEPGAAVRTLRDDYPFDIAGALLDGILEAQDETGDNLLHLPTAKHREGNKWHDRLADLLLEHRGLGVHTLVTRWADPGGPLADRADLVAARAWLRKLGLDPRTDRALFPADDRVVRGELERYRAYTQAAADELQLSADPLALLLDLAPGLDGLPAATVADLLTAACPTRKPEPMTRLDSLTALARELTASAVAESAPGPAADWADDLLRRVQQPGDATDPRPRRIMYGAVLALLDQGTPASRGNLVRRCQSIGLDAYVPAAVSEWLQWASRTGAGAPYAVPRIESPAVSPPARRGPAQLASAIPQRARLPLVAAVVALIGTLGATTALLDLGDDDTPPPLPAAATSPAALPSVENFDLGIAPVVADATDWQRLDQKLQQTPIRRSAATGLRLIAYHDPRQPLSKDEQLRLDDLEAQIRANPPLRTVPIDTELRSPDVDRQAGFLKVLVYYRP
ncbi:hypothetical protein [Symbioplanes lichenis]|uniref:hypothetical protein n=1 Tax=Symbioplanes lichenis TaxID=1629072 RepID=UPI00273A4750|nr:hypothetical protein [Actinoplanes lichenis]